MLSISLALGDLNSVLMSTEASVLAVLSTSEGTLEVLSSDDPIEIMVSSPAAYAGTYTVTQADIEAAPVNLVPARLVGTAQVGQTVGYVPGLWVHDALKPAAVIVPQWQRDGVDIAGATLSNYVVQPADAGGQLSVQETAAQPGGGTYAQSSTAVLVPDTMGPRTFVISLIGQSNMVGFAPFDGGASYPANVMQVARSGRFSGAASGEIVPAQTLLDHHDGAASYMGLALQFAIDHMAAYPEDTLILVPDAKGATGLATGHWNKGDFYYNATVSRLNTLMAENPGYEFCGFLWHQGESDAGNATDAAAYQASLDAMIADLRTDVTAADAGTPFVLGGMVPSWVAGDANRQTVQAALADTPNRVSQTAFVDSGGLSPVADGIHFDAASLRSLGSDYFAAFAAISAHGTPPPSAWQIDGAIIQSAITVPPPSVEGTVVSEGI